MSQGSFYSDTSATTWYMFTYEQDLFSSLQVAKAFQVDGSLKKQTVRSTVRKTTNSEDGVVRVVEEPQEWQVLHFDPAWKVPVSCGWNGYMPREWNFYLNGMVFHRGVFGVKHSVSGTYFQLVHWPSFQLQSRVAAQQTRQVGPRPYLMAMELKASNGEVKRSCLCTTARCQLA